MLTVLGSSLHGLSALHPRTKNTFLLCRSLHISLQSDRVSTSRWRIKEHRDLCGSRALVTPTPNMLEKQADSPRNSRAIKNFCEGGLLGCTCRSISLIISVPTCLQRKGLFIFILLIHLSLCTRAGPFHSLVILPGASLPWCLTQAGASLILTEETNKWVPQSRRPFTQERGSPHLLYSQGVTAPWHKQSPDPELVITSTIRLLTSV